MGHKGLNIPYSSDNAGALAVEPKPGGSQFIGESEMNRVLAKALVLVAGVGLMAACTSGSSNNSSNNKFSGTTIRVVTFTGPQIAEPLQRRAPDFEKLTGAKVQVITVPFSDLYQKVLTDFATKTNSYDATVFDPQWMGDYVPPGYLEDLSDRVKNDSAIQWNDIAPFFRDFSATFKGKIYTIPLDGDFQMVYYRTDLLQKDGLKAPETWNDYISIAQHFQGKDLNGDGKADYGSCMAMKRSAQSYWMIISIAAAFLQSQGTKQGTFFSTDNMQPLMNNPAMAQGRRGDPAGLEAGARPLQRAAGRLQLDALPLRHQRRQPLAFRSLRWLVGRGEQGRAGQGQGRRIRVPLLHVTAGAVRRRRHHRQDRLQPVPSVALQQPQALA